jgi:hypothetical protein
VGAAGRSNRAPFALNITTQILYKICLHVHLWWALLSVLKIPNNPSLFHSLSPPPARPPPLLYLANDCVTLQEKKEKKVLRKDHQQKGLGCNLFMLRVGRLADRRQTGCFIVRVLARVPPIFIHNNGTSSIYREWSSTKQMAE